MDKLRVRGAIWLAVYLVLVSGGLLFFFRSWTYDDPFITYRYAANLAEGRGFVYNPGVRVLSTTSPLLAVALAGLNLLGADIPAAAVFLGAVSLAAGGVLLWDIARRLGLPAAGWVCAALYPTSPLLVSTLGSETPVYLAFCLGAVSAYLSRRYSLSAVLLGLAVLARADAVVIGGLLAADWLARTWSESRSLRATLQAVPLRAVLAGAAIVLPWAVFGWAYFGSPLPATLAAKQAQGLLNPADRFLPGLWLLVERLAVYPHYWLLFILVPAGLLISFRYHARWLLLLLWPVLFVAGYTLLGVTRYPWYYASLVPGAIAAAGLALGNALETPKRSIQTWEPAAAPGRRWVRVAGLAVLVLLVAGQLGDLHRLQSSFDTRYPIYREIGLWLAENTPPNATVATLEVGIIGYYARPRPMIDFTGLIQPEIAARFAPGTSFPEAAVWAAERYHPEVFVLSSGRFIALQAGYLRENCEAAVEFRGVDFGYDQDMLVYLCG
jgi:hypothetical protein